MQAVQKLVILPNEKIGEISPYLHGNFAEHLGELVYPGIWVGEQSAIPNTRGIRNDVVAALKATWPGNRTVNIVCHGHSVPAGYFKTPVVDTFNAYPHLLHRGLKDRFPFAVINSSSTRNIFMQALTGSPSVRR